MSTRTTTPRIKCLVKNINRLYMASEDLRARAIVRSILSKSKRLAKKTK